MRNINILTLIIRFKATIYYLMNSLIKDLMTLFSGTDSQEFSEKDVNRFKVVLIIAVTIAVTITYSKVFI